MQCVRAMFVSRASNVHLTKMWSVPLIRCLPKMSPSSSTSTGSHIATWRRSLTGTRREFIFDLQSLLTGKIFGWLPAFPSEHGSTRYTSAPSITAVWSIRLHITTSLKSISQKRWLYHQILKWSFWPAQLYQRQSGDQSPLVPTSQITFSWYPLW